MNQVYRQFVLFVTIIIRHPAPLAYGHSLSYQGSLTSNGLLLLVNLSLCALCNSKLQDNIFHPMKLLQIIFHVGYGVRGVASVLGYHIEVDGCPDASKTTFERNCLRPSSLAQRHRQNSQSTAPQIPHLFPLPWCKLAVGLFGDHQSGVWR